ncbi:MAG: DNA-3-methyladenine glycosylase [Chloroflexi bacterium]|nr:DNA-3-methyladenine glycosylase [Chloroflexota bacterium]
MGRGFYARPTLVVARDMLGKTLVHLGADNLRRSGRIVETEAYVGPDDQASHARVGAHGRAAIMYGQAGMAYVYLVYGLHHCFNAVTEQEGYPGAVLVRAIEPLENAERGAGPALVCRALQIDRSCTGLDLTASALFLEDAPMVADPQVRVGARIGVDYAGEWAMYPWRFWVADSTHLSRPRLSGSPVDPAMLR